MSETEKRVVQSESFEQAKPFSLEGEQSLLGALLNDRNIVSDAIELLSPRDFYHVNERAVFNAIIKLAEGGDEVVIDAVTVAGWLRENSDREMYGYLSDLSAAVDPDGWRQYASIVKTCSVERQTRDLGNRVNTIIADSDLSATDKLIEINKMVAAVQESAADKTSGSIRGILDVMYSAMGDLLDRMDDSKSSGVMTGFDDIDEKTSGLQRGDLIIIAGRPSMGKTSLAMNFIENISINGRCLVFSMEMSPEQLGLRMLSGQSGIDFKKIREGDLSSAEWELARATSEKISSTQLIIDGASGLSASDVRARARKVAKDGPLECIMIDYLQLMDGGNGRSRNEEMSVISREMKAMAKELNCPVLALSQLSRDCEKRADKRPMNSDLRESGAIEQDADIIIFVYRDEVYNKETKFPGLAEIIFSKHRNGEIGTVDLEFDRNRSRFLNRKPLVFSNVFTGTPDADEIMERGDADVVF